MHPVCYERLLLGPIFSVQCSFQSEATPTLLAYCLLFPELKMDSWTWWKHKQSTSLHVHRWSVYLHWQIKGAWKGNILIDLSRMSDDINESLPQAAPSGITWFTAILPGQSGCNYYITHFLILYAWASPHQSLILYNYRTIS